MMKAIVRKTFMVMNFNDQLRFLRKRQRKTQTVVGDLVGLTARSIRAYETAERIPDFGTLSMLMEILCEDKFEMACLHHGWQKVVEAQQLCFRSQCKKH